MTINLNLYILDADNHVVKIADNDFTTWGKFMSGSQRHVAVTEIDDQTSVSTVFLGIDLRIYGNGPPLLFETMIFGGPLNENLWRYSSYDDAQTGHAMAVAKARTAEDELLQALSRGME
jgi:hypothetical protein